MGILRVFPRRTKATPDDEMAFVGDPPLFRPDADEVHVSCTFTWDRPEAKRLAHAWAQYYSIVKLGGPAYDDPGGEFTNGMYLNPSYTITSRGCPNRCDFCLVPEREGKLYTLPIRNGWDVLDNNLLACHREHIEAVMEMLASQPHRARFTGGIEAARVQKWWAAQAAELKTEILYLAFDRKAQANSVERAVGLLRGAGLRQRAIGCYVLIGRDGDTLQDATNRLKWVFGIGATPYAMYYRNQHETQTHPPREWRNLVREWIRPALIFSTKDKHGTPTTP